MHRFVERPNSQIERIQLYALDGIINELSIEKIDFIKVDIDGHEPAFIDGALNTILKFRPKILLEVSASNYFKAGVTVWEFYKTLNKLDFKIYSEQNLEEIANLEAFLLKCGNFTHSHDIILSFDPL